MPGNRSLNSRKDWAFILESLLPFLIYSALVIVSALSVPLMSLLLGMPRHSPYKDTPYESGIAPKGSAHVRQMVPYYLVAIFFILFDVEVVFLYPWAVRMYALSWSGFLKAFVFLIFVFAGLVYVWLRGGLIWRHRLKTASDKVTSSPS